MKHFGRTGRNRSQHNLVGPAVASSSGGLSLPHSPPDASSGNAPPSASFPSSESFSQVLDGGSKSGNTNNTNNNNIAASNGPPRTQTQPLPHPPHGVSIYSTPSPSGIAQLQHSNTVSAPYDGRNKESSDYVDQVSRSQSHRFSLQQTSPIHPQQQQPPTPQQQQQLLQQQYGLASVSTEDLSGSTSVSSPLAGQSQSLNPQHPQYSHHPPAQGPPPPKKSTRKLIKNILSGSSTSSSGARGSDHSHQPPAPSSSYSNLGGLGRRSSKRASVTPQPAVRTGPSQVSLDQPQADWQTQGPPTQPSPLHAGEFQDSYIASDSSTDPRLQNSHDQNQHSTIRAVSGEAESPYSPEELAYYRQQGHIQLQGPGQIPPELHQQNRQQLLFDQQQQQQQQFQGNHQHYSGHLGNPQQQNPETVSQLSHDSPGTDLEQRIANNTQSAQGTGGSYNSPVQDSSASQSNPNQAPSQSQQQQQQQSSNMAPPAGGPPPNRRSQENEKVLREIPPPHGPPPGYQRHGQQASQLSAPNAQGTPNQSYRQPTAGDSQQRPPQFDGQIDSQGRNSPQPPSERGETDPDKAMKDLVTKYKNVKRLYFDGKKEIELLNGQIEQLQNAIANQRMSQSRTSLDDSEYATRFNRLNGAIQNLSFNIRKDWVTVPSWLSPFVSVDALKTGKQEMTAMGRAVISRWVVEEIFHRSFHPSLEPELSRHLKTIEQNIRHFSYTMNSQEEMDALTGKVVSWRMATLEGLQDVLRGPEAASHRSDFTRRATTNLTASLFQHLSDPPPAGVDGSASMIVELAVGIASNLPLESRDVAISYPLPEQQIQPHIMDVEKVPLPPLEPREDVEEAEAEQAKDKDKDGKDRRAEKTRSGMLTTILGTNVSSAPNSRKGSVVDPATLPAGQPPQPPPQQGQQPPPPPKDSSRIRYAGFLAVEVRGRQVLVKAPVWPI